MLHNPLPLNCGNDEKNKVGEGEEGVNRLGKPEHHVV